MIIGTSGRLRQQGDVFFDNLTVQQRSGPITEETHYYPFGLTMAGLSDKAAGSLQNKEKTFQGQRFDDDLGLNWIQFKWRNHNPQIGRFIEIDPLADEYVYNSTYAFSENKVTGNVELEGLESTTAPLPGAAPIEVDVPSEAPGVGGLIGGLMWLENKMDERLKDIYAHPENYPGNKIAEMYLQQRIDKANADAKIELSKPIIQPADTKKGVIYEVPGSHTKSGKPYVGRTKNSDPAKRKSDGGRDRKQAKVVDKYDPDNVQEGREKEQRKIDEKGLDNLDNKRNEIKPPKPPDRPKPDPDTPEKS